MKRTGDSILLIFGILASWQVLYWLAGDVALTSPATTAAHLWKLLGTARFLEHAAETARAFGLAVLISLLVGGALAVILRLNPPPGIVSPPCLIPPYSSP